MRAVWGLRALWATQIVLTVAAFTIGWGWGVAAAVLLVALPALGHVIARHGAFEPEHLGVLERVGHPELFRVVDAAAAAIGTETFDRLYVANHANAWAARVGWKRAVVIGMPNLPFYTLADLKSTLAHEIAHHSAGDIDDPAVSANGILTGLASLWIYPLFPLARLFLKLAQLEMAASSRQRERAADFWASLVAGAGSLAESLRTEGRVAVMWDWVERDLKVLAAQNKRPHNVYEVLRDAWARADMRGYLHDVDDALEAAPTAKDDTHPAFRDRVDDNLRLTAGLELAARNDVYPVNHLLGGMEALETEMSERLLEQWHAKNVEVVAAEDLERAFVAALDKDARTRMEERFGACMRGLSYMELLNSTGPLLTKAMKNKDPQVVRESDERRLVTMLLDLAVAHGELRGEFTVGAPRTVVVGDSEWYAWHLARQLLVGELTWTALARLGTTPARLVRGVSGVHASPTLVAQAAKT